MPFDDNDFVKMFGPTPMVPVTGLPDTLPTHPERKSPESMQERFDFQVKVRQFDLAREDDVKEMEAVLTKIVYGTALELKQKWSSDKDGSVMVALSWVNLVPKKRRKRPGEAGENPWGTHGENPGIPDEGYPGHGAVIPVPPPPDARGDEEE